MDRFPASSEMLPTSWANEILTAELAAITAVNVSLDADLVVSSAAFTTATVWADLTIASYAGYATKAFTAASLVTKQTEPNGSRRVQSSTLITFAEPTSGDPVTAYGIAYTETGGNTKLYRLHRFDVPVVMSVGGGVLNHVATLTERAGNG